ncbi:hypothetical protein KUCAC02_008625, partial [Chaenocephalus aceratus]
GTVAGYQILHMDSNYLVGFTTGEELLKLAHRWSEGPPEKGSVSENGVQLHPEQCRKGWRICSPQVSTNLQRKKSLLTNPTRYLLPMGVRRRRMPSSSDPILRSLAQGEAGGVYMLHCHS